MPTFIFVPFPDKEIDGFVKKWAAAKKYQVLHPRFFGSRTLRPVGEDDRLYVVCHGSRIQPVVSGNGKQYTAEQLANLLRKEWGLKAGHQDLRMFSCYSGLATFNQRIPNEEEKAEIKSMVDVRCGGPAASVLNKHKKFPLAYQQVMNAKFLDANYYNANLDASYDEGQSPQRLPFAAYLASFLKTAGCTRIVVTGYHAPVWMHYGKGKTVLRTPNGHAGDRAQYHRTRWDGDGNSETWNGITWEWEGIAWM